MGVSFSHYKLIQHQHDSSGEQPGPPERQRPRDRLVLNTWKIHKGDASLSGWHQNGPFLQCRSLGALRLVISAGGINSDETSIVAGLFLCYILSYYWSDSQNEQRSTVAEKTVHTFITLETLWFISAHLCFECFATTKVRFRFLPLKCCYTCMPSQKAFLFFHD